MTIVMTTKMKKMKVIMLEISSKPSLIKRMPFGKHQGVKMDEIPVDYQQWLSTTDLDEDMKFTVNHYLTNTKVS